VGTYGRGLEWCAFFLRISLRDHGVIKRPPGERKRQAGGKKIAAAQVVTPIEYDELQARW
jgi:hypothetical protein